MKRPDPNNNPENQYAIGRKMRVRKLTGIYEIIDSRMIGKRRRYTLKPVLATGAALNETEAYGDAMQPVPEPEPAPPLSLAPDPAPAAASQEHASPAGLAEPAPIAERAAPAAIRSPDDGVTLDAGTFGGELDEYSVGARYPDEPGELKNPYKPVRKFPQRPRYQDLRGIVYNSRFKGLEDLSSNKLASLQEGTPIGVAVTHETNGHAVWIITTESGDELRQAYLEQYYPKMTGSEADAIEYAVLLALRQIPIRTEDLEILLLELA